MSAGTSGWTRMLDDTTARTLHVEGIVQGVGFRPFVHQLAHRCGLSGTVANTGDGVRIHVEGPAAALDRFQEAVTAEAPPLALVTRVPRRPAAPGGGGGFRILESDAGAGRSTLISPDVAVCRDCLSELFDPADRRHRYPFINCTNCGPRYTIIEDIPYDRPKTSMRAFTMCAPCRAEYDDPADRRFHAQPNACPDCGPRVWLAGADGRPLEEGDPVAAAIDRLVQGDVLAVKGLGGFHLAADAANPGAVAALRRRKRREEKPFALMAADLERVRGFARVSDEEADLLRSPRRPIVLLEKRPGHLLAPGVSPDNRCFGVMLPYTPLHHLLMEGPFPALVMTSGNASDEPIAIANDEAVERLSGIADAFLLHDRDICLRSDDSIVRRVAGHPRMLRRSRGYVPVPVFLDGERPPVLAVGAELKNTICLLKGDRAFLGQHVGDLENRATYGFFLETIRHLQRILDVAPAALACDRHPDYLSTRFADEEASLPVIRVQHHHAHIVSCLAENRTDGPVIGLSLDGTGYGDDGTVWGGEVLVADAAGFERAGRLERVPMPGAAAAVREPWRMAVSCLLSAFGEDFPGRPLPWLAAQDPARVAAMVKLCRAGVNAPLTSSAGRLFDAVASLVGLKDRSAFEGQAAMLLEMAADPAPAGRYEASWSEGPPLELAVGPIVRGVVSDLEKGVSIGVISRRFHDTLAAAFRDVCRRLRSERGLARVALSGGVFQNALLFGRLAADLASDGFEVLSHRLVPTNDGGIALGQAVAAAARLRREETQGPPPDTTP